MSGTFSQLYVQIVFAVKGRAGLIESHWETDLHKYISGIVRQKGQKLIVINGMPDHLHLLIGMTPSCCLSDLVREIKKSSNKYINEKRFTSFRFQWQEGFGAFSYHQSNLEQVIQYIENQKIHHTQRSFREEYIDLLRMFGIPFKVEYLFDGIDEDPERV